MITALFPGSFDPFTLGHLDIVKRAAQISDQVIVGVTHNPNKQWKLDFETRVAIIEESLKTEQLNAAVRVKQLPAGLLVTAAKELGATHLIKGLRNAQDFSYEEPMARMNQEIGQMETIFLLTKAEYAHVSSSLVKEIHSLGADVTSYLPPAAIKSLNQAKSQTSNQTAE